MSSKKKRKSKLTVKTAPENVDIKYELIKKYRQLIEKRYDYKSIGKNIPKGITPEAANTLKDYFLQHLYPEPVKREKLDAAFAELENFILHPSKIWDLLGNITHAIFQFGFQFPAAVRAGLVSLEAYSSAKHFENTLVQAAVDNGLKVPISDEDFFTCITVIPKPELDHFVAELEQLFKIFTNTDLLSKTISIMQGVVKKMKKKPDMYSRNEIEAIEMGLAIMQNGYNLFIQFDDKTKEVILRFISENEKKFLDSLY